MNSAAYLAANTVVMQGPKDALIAPDRVHLGEVQLLPELVTLGRPRAFGEGFMLLIRTFLPKKLFDNALPFLAHMGDNAIKVLDNRKRSQVGYPYKQLILKGLQIYPFFT